MASLNFFPMILFYLRKPKTAKSSASDQQQCYLLFVVETCTIAQWQKLFAFPDHKLLFKNEPDYFSEILILKKKIFFIFLWIALQALLLLRQALFTSWVIDRQQFNLIQLIWEFIFRKKYSCCCCLLKRTENVLIRVVTFSFRWLCFVRFVRFVRLVGLL